MLGLLADLGFEANEAKCDGPSRVQVFLGVGMNSLTMQYFFTAERLERMRRACLDLEHASGSVRVSRIMSVVGQWGFLATIVPGLALYLRSGYQCMRGKERSSFVPLSRAFRLDLAFLRRMISLGALTVSMTRRPLTSGFAAWDACTGWGMGAYLDGLHFAVSWHSLMAGEHGTVERFFPFQKTNPGSDHINYLELFAAYWFLRLWGERLRGHCVVCHTDSTVVEGMLKHLSGQPTFIPLLKEILRMLVSFDVSLDVHRIGTKENVLADALSRGAIQEFHAHAARFINGPGVSLDTEDWQMSPDVFDYFDRWLGPFQYDACVDKYRTNSHCPRSWTAGDDCRRQRWHGLTVWCNGPFSLLYEILMHFLLCKAEMPVGTAALFILPLWVPSDFMTLVHSMPRTFQVVARFPAGSQLFTAPVPAHAGGGRRYVGDTRWPVVAVWVGPEPLVG